MRAPVVVELPSGEYHASCTIGTHTVSAQAPTRERALELLERELRRERPSCSDRFWDVVGCPIFVVLVLLGFPLGGGVRRS